MAAQKIRSANANGLPRCKSEGTLIDFSSGVPDPNLNDVKVLSPSSLLINDPASLENVKEVVAIKDYCPNNFTTLKFSKGEHLYVLDTSGGDWWYAHNTTEMGYIPSAYVQPLNYRDSCLSDSGMIDGLLESVDEGVKELDLLGDWNDFLNQNSIKTHNNNPFMRPSVSNPFLNGPLSSSQNVTPDTKSSVDLLLFDPLTTSNVTSTETSTDILLDLHPHTGRNQNVGEPTPARRDNPFFRSKRSYSLSELSVLQAKSDSPATGSFFAGLKSPAPEQFQSREDFRTAWLNHRKLARSCHDLDMLGQNPGWGQTQPVETSIVCRLDSSGGAVQLPDTNISILVPEGHVAGTETQQISLKALLDPPLELNNDKCTTVSPVLEVKLSNMEVQTSLTLEVKVSVELHSSIASMSSVKINCLRSDAKEGPYTLMPQTYIYGDTVQVKLDNLEPVMYLVMVAQGQHIVPPSTVWEYISKKVTVGLYGPKHMHPLFKAVVAIFGHDCAPKTLLVSEVGQQINSAPVTLHLWGKQQFVLPRPQDIKMCLFSNMTNYRVEAGDQGKMVRGFQLKLGKVSRLIFPISCQDPAQLSDFTLRVQVRDELGNILSQYCVQTPQPPPKAGGKSTGPRRFLKKKEVGRIVLSPLAVTYKYPTFQDRPISNMKYGKLLKTVIRQSKNQYLLEYKKGDVVGLLSEEKIRLKGQLWTKEWYIGYYQGKVGLIHAKNVLVVGKVKPNYFSGPELTTSSLMEQILRPCKFLTYIYASVRTHLMENIGSWRAFADALGYGNLPLSYFCRVEVESEPERVASVLEKLKEECNNNEGKEKKSFQKELIAALLKIDCQGLVVRLIQDFVLLTTAVEVAQRWRELAEKLSKVSKQQMDGYEAPHRDRNGMLDSEAMWKPAYDFLLTWSSQMGDSYRDVIQELHTGLDRMRNPITKRWKHLTGTLIFVNSLEILRAMAFSTHEEDDCVI